ncbi:RING finger protein 145 [Lingula anatina]|uniref:RING finger protein 145 n=1 Tax=Lingula anatina TaxID=7574 RepID=A0A1S3HA90_LINAN|nr:RING finger protein 145 [Lingula anatina]|eukprot:XP_013382029.1 RING finger protein 145 [Lingula anatina]
MPIESEFLLTCVNVILRVPALYIYEIWSRDEFSANIQKQLGADEAAGEGELAPGAAMLDLTLPCLALAIAFLPIEKLVDFYMYVMSAVLVIICAGLCKVYIMTEIEDFEKSGGRNEINLMRLGIHLSLQCLIISVITYLLHLKHWTRFTLLVYTVPIIARLCYVNPYTLLSTWEFGCTYSVILVIILFISHLSQIFDVINQGLHEASVGLAVYGWLSYILILWRKLSMQVQFLLFWVSMFFFRLYINANTLDNPLFEDGWLDGWLLIFLASIGDCCGTAVSVFGLCVTVSYASYATLAATKLYLQGWNGFTDDLMLHGGWTEGFTMFLLAMQTGITELKSEERAFLMSIVLFILVSSLLQSMYEITDPILLGLSASHNKSLVKHVKAVLLCTFLWIFPLFMTYIICSVFDVDLWLLVIVSSCLLTSVQVIGSLVVYSLFFYDALLTEPWEKLDDYVYYARATIRVLEFLVAVFVVFYGTKESIFGQWSWINSSILIIHFYFNIWQRAQEGWRSFLLRKEAVTKILSLPEATEEQLAAHNDVCAICYQELKTARITPCQHYFHALCLRKWFYVQNRCPMCHTTITMPGEGTATEAEQDEELPNEANIQDDVGDDVPRNEEARDDVPANEEAPDQDFID